MSEDFKKAALDYHAEPRPGKIRIEISTPAETQNDLALAYSPGVAEPVRAIAENPEDAYLYTAKGNLVAVISESSLADCSPQERTTGRESCHNVNMSAPAVANAERKRRKTRPSASGTTAKPIKPAQRSKNGSSSGREPSKAARATN